MVIKPQAFVAAVLLALPAPLIAGEPGQRAQDRRPAEIRFQGWTPTGTARSRGPNGAAAINRSSVTTGMAIASSPATKFGSVPRAISAKKATTTIRPGRNSGTGPSVASPISTAIATDGSPGPNGSTTAKASSGRIATRDNALTREEFLSGDVDVDREDRFEYLDANRNGRIERTEWHASRDAFTWLDRNRDGVLSRQKSWVTRPSRRTCSRAWTPTTTA